MIKMIKTLYQKAVRGAKKLIHKWCTKRPLGEKNIEDKWLNELVEEAQEKREEKRIERVQQEAHLKKAVDLRQTSVSPNILQPIHVYKTTLQQLKTIDLMKNKGPISPLHRYKPLIKAYKEVQEKVIYLYPRAPTLMGLTTEHIYILHRYG